MHEDEDATASSRRGFLRLSGFRAGRLLAQAGGVPLPARSTAPSPVPLAPPVVDAAPATRTCTPEELDALATANGLAGHRDVVRALATTSLRATPARPDVVPAAWSGGGRRDDAGRTLVLHVDLGAPGAGAFAARLPEARHLRIWARAAGIDGVRDVHVETVSAAAPRGAPLELTEELVLPHVWCAEVRALALDDDARAGWDALRRDLAAHQGTEPDDAGVAWHRLGGHADEWTGTLPVVCERFATGLAEDVPEDAELEERAGRWALLAQLTADPAGLGWDWGPDADRLYVFADRHALRAGDLTQVVAIAR